LVHIRDKVKLRKQYKRIREALSPEEVRTGSEAVCVHLNGWQPFQQADTVLGFHAFRNEIDLGQLFEHWRDKQWLAPRVAEGIELEPGQKPYLMLHPYDPNRLVRHRFGMLEPEAGLPIVAPSEVKLVLVPGVAFDRQGGRLGFGGGFYDRLLPLASEAIWVGVTYEQLILDVIPMEPWDRHVDWLVTPDGLHRTSGGRGQRVSQADTKQKP
jgi:5-formyltetrahydrofolate cyclo-ligase